MHGNTLQLTKLAPGTQTPFTFLAMKIQLMESANFSGKTVVRATVGLNISKDVVASKTFEQLVI